ncbi:plastid transcriptionally active [Thalictrum thalictroides]|uniref:Plastid transcriptionally active n=1 Tax=Thalictrum thalictroides TaxID=46969 RepID=A0A7J6V4D1_THATH|nr:plastid transcriptionally active [Thalictrum thalictroides]
MSRGIINNPLTSSPFLSLPLFSSPSYLLVNKTHKVISATLESVNNSGQLTAKERRQLRNERREEKTTNWREEVEEKLLKKQKKRYANWKEELNLDNLALEGPQWWAVRVSRVNGHETAERLARYLARIFPDIEFKVYAPAVHVKRKLKNGTVSVKPKPLFPGCIFLRCVLNKELHDTIRECPGIGGFIGSKVGNTKRQINRPKSVSVVDIESMFRQAKEEQEKADQAFADDQKSEEILKNEDINLNLIKNVMDSVAGTKPKRRTRKASAPVTSSPSIVADDKLLTPGSSIRVVSGSFSDFKGNLKKLDAKSGMATVRFTLFGKESLVDLDINQIVADIDT